MGASISTVVYRDPVREFQRVAGGPVVRLWPANANPANANDVQPQGAVVLSVEAGDIYRWSDPHRGSGLSWYAWSATLALHGLVAVMIAAVAWTSRPVPPALPTVTVVFESSAAPQPAVAQPETPPPAPPAPPRTETPPVAPPAAPAPAAVTAPAQPMQVAVLPPPPPPRPPPVSRPRPTSAPTPVSTPAARAPAASHSAPAPSTAVAVVPVIPPRPVSGIASNRKPVYPLAARNQRWQGRVVLQVDVAASGNPLSVHVVASSGHALLDDSALAAVRTWRFVPASQGGRPISGTVDVPVDFRMVD